MTCLYCEGKGCEECDQRGTRYREAFQTDEGIQIAVSGSGAFDPSLAPAFEALAKAAFARMDES